MKKVAVENEDYLTAKEIKRELENIKNTLYKIGAIYSSMSGTGSSVYGIFNELPDLEGVFNKGYQIVKV